MRKYSYHGIILSNIEKYRKYFSTIKKLFRAKYLLSCFGIKVSISFHNHFQVDENTRASMWKLRQTWNDVFPPKKLFSLDVRVQSIDPAWPITAPSNSISSGSIHVNPRFLSMVSSKHR